MRRFLSIYGSEFLAAGACATLVAAIVAADWLRTPPSAPPEREPAEIVTFRSMMMEGQLPATVLAQMRLESGMLVMLPIPKSARTRQCRAGDRVQLIRRGSRLYFPVEGCGP